MSLHIMAQGQLTADPVHRESKSGKPFVTAQLRVTAEDESLLLSVIAFDATVCDLLTRLKKGDAVAVSGRAKPTSWLGQDGEQRRGLSVVAAGALAIEPKSAKTTSSRAPRRPRYTPKRQPGYDAGDWQPPESDLSDIGA